MEKKNPEIEQTIKNTAYAIRETIKSNNHKDNMIHHLEIVTKQAIENAYHIGVLEVLDREKEAEK